MLSRFLRQDPHLPVFSSFACPPSSLPRCRLADYAMAAALVLLMVPDAEAATYRYASSTNRIYVENGGTATLGAIRAGTPSLPASALVRSGNTWTLNAYLHVEDGTTLQLHGSAIGGDVDELRIKSDSGGFVYVWAEHGNLHIDSTRIRSWNASASAPDTNHTDGRAFIRVRSYIDGSGLARESRMDIIDSDVGYLGYNAAESYGLAWKVIGDHGTNYELFDKVDVFGDIIGSDIHHNYFGVYTYGHNGGQWLDNHVHDNVKYGFDPHDDSDNLLIQGNDVHDNGNHGIIASKRCNNVTIRNNRSYGNTGNGIMLHRASNDALVEGNQSYLNTDSGIALYANRRSIVRNNIFLDNANAGIRLSNGEQDSVIDNNEVGHSAKGLYFYKGNDAPEPGDDGRPKRSSFTGNRIHDISENGIQMTDADSISFTSNVFSALAAPQQQFERSTRVKFNKNTLPADAIVDLQGDSSKSSDIDVYNTATLRVTLDDFSTARFRDNSRRIFDPDEALYTVASTSSSLLTLTRANTAGSTTVILRQLTATPASGTVKVQPTAWGGTTGTKSFSVQAASSSVSVAYTVGNLAAGTQYQVLRGSSVIGSYTADSAGKIAFSDAPGSTSTVNYTIRPG
ncbi:MAG TPA: right-handed parallel beta-helix repeat-containing protein [Verrucomicrobiae bacterium]|nr:right-handed parallel beta-helix repeat-containing protein [Verrucomicrobiae bacterium]